MITIGTWNIKCNQYLATSKQCYNSEDQHQWFIQFCLHTHLSIPDVHLYKMYIPTETYPKGNWYHPSSSQMLADQVLQNPNCEVLHLILQRMQGQLYIGQTSDSCTRNGINQYVWHLLNSNFFTFLEYVYTDINIAVVINKT